MTSDSNVLRLAFWPVALVSSIPSLWIHLTSYRQLPAYGWGMIPLVSHVACSMIVARRWDRSLKIPSRLPALMLVGLGLGLSALRFFSARPWLSGQTVFLLGMSFLVTHTRNSTQAAMILSWPLLLSFLSTPPLAELFGQSVFVPVLRASVANVWTLFDVPQVAYPTAIVLPHGTVFFDELLSSIWSLPLFLFLCSLMSVLLKRTSLEAMCNLVAAVPAYLLFSVGTVATFGVMATHYDIDPEQPSAQWAVRLSLGNDHPVCLPILRAVLPCDAEPHFKVLLDRQPESMDHLLESFEHYGARQGRAQAVA